MNQRNWKPLLGAAWFAGEFLNGLSGDLTQIDAVGARTFLGQLAAGVVVAALAGAGCALAVSALVRRLAKRLPPARADALLRSEWLLFAPSVLSFGGGLGVLPQSGAGVQATLALTCAGLVALIALRPSPAAAVVARPRPIAELYLLFFGSGLAALIYQVVWQRTLFSLYGANIESTTVVVATFMLGLGLGGLLGGWLSVRFPKHGATVFFAIELGIGAFGLVSLPLIRAVGLSLANAPTAVVSLSVVGLLGLPTMLMGATLPVLVAHLNRELAHVGRSVALLYAINTAGSALACFLTVDVLFVWFGQSGAVVAAATCNFLVGALVYRFIRNTRAPLVEVAT